MPCPVDGTNLIISERSGIEIDYCPTCRGVWLDRGELDKILERSVSPPPSQGSMPRESNPFDHGREQREYGRDDRHYGQRKRKKSFLEEIFD